MTRDTKQQIKVTRNGEKRHTSDNTWRTSISVTFDRTHRHETKTLGIHFISDTKQLVERK